MRLLLKQQWKKKMEKWNILQIDLIAEEFKVRKHCYDRLTHGFRSSLASIKKNNAFQNSAHSTIYKKDNFDKIKEYNKTHVIKNENVLQRKFCMRFIILQLVILDTGVS